MHCIHFLVFVVCSLQIQISINFFFKILIIKQSVEEHLDYILMLNCLSDEYIVSGLGLRSKQ